MTAMNLKIMFRKVVYLMILALISDKWRLDAAVRSAGWPGAVSGIVHRLEEEALLDGTRGGCKLAHRLYLMLRIV